MNTSRMNRLEELGRVDAEKAYTKTGKANLSDEKSRIVRELKADGGKVKQKWITKKSDTKPKAWITKKKKEDYKEIKVSNTQSGLKQKPKAWITKKEKPKKSRADIRERAAHADGGSVMGRGQGKVMRNKPTYIISMKD